MSDQEREIFEELLRNHEKTAERIEASVLEARKLQEAAYLRETWKDDELSSLRVLLEGSPDGMIDGLFPTIKALSRDFQDFKIEVSKNLQEIKKDVDDRFNKLQEEQKHREWFWGKVKWFFTGWRGIITFILSLVSLFTSKIWELLEKIF